MRSLASLAMIITLASASTVLAEPANMVGFGFSKCRDVTARIVNEPDVTLEVFQWAAGYMSGLNSYDIVSRKQFRDFGDLIVDGKGGAITKPLLADCINNPDMTLGRVVDRFYVKLPTRKWAQ